MSQNIPLQRLFLCSKEKGVLCLKTHSFQPAWPLCNTFSTTLQLLQAYVLQLLQANVLTFVKSR